MAGLSAALFAAPDPVTRDVRLSDGSVHALHFRQLPAAEFRRHFREILVDDEERQARGATRLIAASLCEPDGAAALTEEQAARLTPDAERSILDAILAVNGMTPAGKEPPPSATATTGSGTSSPSPLAAEPSPNGSRP